MTSLTYALRARLARLYAHMRMHMPTRPGNHMHARTSKHTHTPICNSYCFSTATIVRERASLLRYTDIACLVSISAPAVLKKTQYSTSTDRLLDTGGPKDCGLYLFTPFNVILL